MSSKSDHLAAAALYDKHASYAKVAAELGCVPSTAKRWVELGKAARTSIASTRASAYRFATEAYRNVIEYVRLVGHYDEENMSETVKRSANALMEMVQPLALIEHEIADVFAAKFPTHTKQAPMVISLETRVVSLCPHHFLPVIYMVDMAYLPTQWYLGLSKPTRLAELLGRRPVLQETYTAQLADVLSGKDLKGREHVETLGSAVRVRGWHSCMACRGIRHQNSQVVTRALNGSFLNSVELRAEFDSNLPPLPTARGLG